MNKFYYIAGLILLSGCAYPQYSYHVAPQDTPKSYVPPYGMPDMTAFNKEMNLQLSPYKLSQIEIDAVKRGLKEKLKDPDSAKFDDFVAGTNKDKSITVCGLVNAKNSYGGYTGKQPFEGMLIENKKQGKYGFVLIGMGGEDSKTLAIYQVCSEQGLKLKE